MSLSKNYKTQALRMQDELYGLTLSELDDRLGGIAFDVLVEQYKYLKSVSFTKQHMDFLATLKQVIDIRGQYEQSK